MIAIETHGKKRNISKKEQVHKFYVGYTTHTIQKKHGTLREQVINFLIVIQNNHSREYQR